MRKFKTDFLWIILKNGALMIQAEKQKREIRFNLREWKTMKLLTETAS